MANPTPPDLTVLRRFGATPEGRLLVLELQARLAVLDVRNRQAIGEELYRSQGRATEIAELIELFDPSLAAAPGLHRALKPTRPFKLPVVNHMHVPD